MKTLKPVLESDFYDFNIKVYDLENGKYLVRDFKENIQFQCTKETLNFDIDEDETFFDEIFYDKINAQNHMELEGKKDSFYMSCLVPELQRIIEHCENSYKEFEAE